MGCTISVMPHEVDVKSQLNKGDIIPIITLPENTTKTHESIQTLSSGLEFTEIANESSENLFLAVKRGDLATVTIILQKHADNSTLVPVNKMVGMWDSTPLMVALQYGHNEIAKLLLSQKDLGDLTARNNKGADALLFACMEGLSDIVCQLLALGIRPHDAPSSLPVYNSLSDQSLICTALSIAIQNGRQLILGKLLSAIGDEAGNTAFTFAVLKSIQKSSAGGVPSAGATGVSPLSLACAGGHLGVVKELLFRKCTSVDSLDSDQSTVLHHLCRAKQNTSEIFHELRKHELVTDTLLQARDILGDTALHVAAEHKQDSLVSLLLDEGCAVSAKNPRTGCTALHIAIKRKSSEVVGALLEFGADPLATNLEGKAPLDLIEKLRKDNDIYLRVTQAAVAWQGFRGIPALAKVETANSGKALTGDARPPASCEPFLSTAPETTPSEDSACRPDGGENEDDIVTEFTPLEDSFLVEATSPSDRKKVKENFPSAEPLCDPVSPFDLNESLEHVVATKESELLAASPISPPAPLRPVPPPAKEGGASFKRGRSGTQVRQSSVKTPVKPQRNSGSLEGTISIYSTPVKSATETSAALLTPSAIVPVLTPSSPTSAKGVARGSQKTQRPSAVYSSAKMPTMASLGGPSSSSSSSPPPRKKEQRAAAASSKM